VLSRLDYQSEHGCQKMRAFLVYWIPLLLGLAAVLAFLEAGGWETSAGIAIAVGVLCLCVAVIAAIPLLMRRARFQVEAARAALERDLDQRHREREAMNKEEGL
jgi:uncharacterized membrane protein